MHSKDYDFKIVGDGQAVGITVYWDGPDGGKSRPLAILFHGGGFVVGTRFMISQEHIEDLLGLGFVVASTDYSLCPHVSLYDGPERDAKDVYRWCKDKLPDLLSNETDACNLDPTKVVVVGYSAGATLALCLGAESDPPAAIVDFYGAKFFKDSFYASPLPAMAAMPDFDKEFLDKIYDEPLKTSTASSLERSAAKRTGPPKPDLSVPRNAWLFNTLKHGTQLKSIIQDGDYDRVDPTNMFSKSFPPTFFLHGTADDWILPRFSEEAHNKLEQLGVETRLALLPGLVHGFDATLSRDDPKYKHVKEAFQFLRDHV